jgi:hypothetical protein
MFSQHNDNYKRVRLGTCNKTIDQAGCLLCGVAEALDTHAGPMDPARLNRWLNLNGGYVHGCDFVFGSVAGLGLRCVLVADYRDAPADIDTLRRYVAGGYVVLVAVNFNPWGKYQEHWLLACGLEHGDLECLDPWIEQGANAYVGVLSHYARPTWDLADAIYRYAVYDFDNRIAGRTAF